MVFELVLSLTGLLLVSGWILGEGLGCKVTRPIVELDALHTFHSNHRENFRVYTVVGIVVSLDFGAQHVLHLGLYVLQSVLQSMDSSVRLGIYELIQ